MAQSLVFGFHGSMTTAGVARDDLAIDARRVNTREVAGSKSAAYIKAF